VAQVFGTIGSLAQLIDILDKRHAISFNSLEAITLFQANYDSRIAQIKDETRKQLLSERETLRTSLLTSRTEFNIKFSECKEALTKEKDEIERLLNNDSNSQNIFSSIFNSYKRFRLQRRQTLLANEFEKEAKRPLRELENRISSMTGAFDYLNSSFEMAVEDKTNANSRQLHDTNSVLQENKALLLGAIGEQKAVNELSKLPETFYVINNFYYEFSRWLHNKNSGDWIRSIQADHVVVGPSGVFVVETKNWSNDSVHSLDLYSPVEQVGRTSYALFLLLNRPINQGLFNNFNNHWGSKRISVHSIILMVNKTPNQQFQYVKVLSLGNVCKYINYSRQELDGNEVTEVANYLLGTSRGTKPY